MVRLQLRPDLEDAIRQLAGVRAASVVTDAEGAPVEIHVVADPMRSAKQVVRDIQSLALAQFGLETDHRIVSVVQVGSADALEAEADFATAPIRPFMSAIELRIDTQQATVRVTLGDADTEYAGEATGPASPPMRATVVARATAAAAEKLLPAIPIVEHAAVMPLGPRAIAVVVTQLADRVCIGTAAVRGDEADAVVRATLDALNRQFRR